MKNSLFVILYFVFGLILSSCTSGKKEGVTDIFAKKSTELIQHLLLENEHCKCILEPSSETFIEILRNSDMAPERYIEVEKNRLKEQLGIINDLKLDSIIELSRGFDIRKSIKNSEVNFVSRNGLDSAKTLEEFFLWEKSVAKICSDSLCYISNPLFSPDFTKVAIKISLGDGSLPTGPNIYEYVNGKWLNEDEIWMLQ